MAITFPITPVNEHTPGKYPDTVRHISNGDPCNQEYIRYPSLDLEYRSEVLREALNQFYSEFTTNANALEAFDTNHDHSGNNGEKVVDLAQVYANTSADHAFISLSAGKALRIKKSGGEASADLLALDDAGTTNKTKIFFPGSNDLFDHQVALASDLTLNPHGLKLAARVVKVCDSLSVTTEQEVVLTNLNTVTGFVSKSRASLVAPLAEGVITGALTPEDYPQHIVLVLNSSTGQQIFSGPNPVYGLLNYTGTEWKVGFFAGNAPYTFAAPASLKLYGQEAFSLSNIPVVNPRDILYAKYGESYL